MQFTFEQVQGAKAALRDIFSVPEVHEVINDLTAQDANVPELVKEHTSGHAPEDVSAIRDAIILAAHTLGLSITESSPAVSPVFTPPTYESNDAEEE